MNTYTIYQKNSTYRIIKNGNSWCAMFFSWVWALCTRQWTLAAIIFILQYILNVLLTHGIYHYYPASHGQLNILAVWMHLTNVDLQGLSSLAISLSGQGAVSVSTSSNILTPYCIYISIQSVYLTILALVYFRRGNHWHAMYLLRIGYKKGETVSARGEQDALANLLLRR